MTALLKALVSIALVAFFLSAGAYLDLTFIESVLQVLPALAAGFIFCTIGCET